MLDGPWRRTVCNPFLNAAQKLQFAVSPSLLIPHGESGAAKFRDWPSFTAGAHQQMHITEIHRNYEGGLRLLVGLATDNWGAEYLTSKIKNGHTQLVDEPRVRGSSGKGGAIWPRRQ